MLRRIAPDDLPFFTRIHALPEVAQYLWGQGRPRSPEESAAWLQATLASYDVLALGHLAGLRKEDGALIGRCGLTDLAVDQAVQHGVLGVARPVVRSAERHTGDIDPEWGRRECPKMDTYNVGYPPIRSEVDMATTGESHLAQGIGLAVIRQGHRVQLEVCCLGRN